LNSRWFSLKGERWNVVTKLPFERVLRVPQVLVLDESEEVLPPVVLELDFLDLSIMVEQLVEVFLLNLLSEQG